MTFGVDFKDPMVRKICFEILSVRKLNRLRTTALDSTFVAVVQWCFEATATKKRFDFCV